MDTKIDDFAKRDGRTERRTDTSGYRDAMDASKNDTNQAHTLDGALRRASVH